MPSLLSSIWGILLLALLLVMGNQVANAQAPTSVPGNAKEIQKLMAGADKDLKNQDYGPEEEKLNKVIKLDPGIARAYYMRGHIKQMRHDLDGALLDADKAITLAPTANPLYYYQRGLSRFFLTQMFDAALDFTVVIKRQPNFAKAYLYRGYTYANSNELDDAMKDCMAYIKLEPKDPDGLKFKQRLSGEMKSRKK